MNDERVLEMLHAELRQETSDVSDALPSEMPSEAQARAIARVIRRCSLEEAVRRHTGDPEIRLEDHASLVTDLAGVLAREYPAAGQLLWDLACDLLRIERDKTDGTELSPVLLRRHERSLSNHRQLLEHWKRLREQQRREEEREAREEA